MSDAPGSTTGTGQQTALLFLHAQTALHPGSGTALGTVDLPVQRERHTQWPVIPGSSLKGILRDACRRRSGNNANLFAAFGPETPDADKYAGALSLTDARILAFPVRSLRGIFAWVTCPAVLERLDRDLKLGRWRESSLPRIPSLDETDCLLNTQTDGGRGGRHPLLVDDNKLVLEEYEFTHVGQPPAEVVRFVQRTVTDDVTSDHLGRRLVILHNDYFSHFVRHATEVVARVGLDYERKTVKTGALFYQEFLPAETLFYSLVFANPSRRDNTQDAAAILGYLSANLPEPSVLQVGGDETTGKGLCSVRLDQERSA